MIPLLLLSASFFANVPAPDAGEDTVLNTPIERSINDNRVAIRETCLEWRYTPVGWRQVPVDRIVWIKSDPVAKSRPTFLHPLTWTALLVLIVSGLVAWASDEWDWSRVAE